MLIPYFQSINGRLSEYFTGQLSGYAERDLLNKRINLINNAIFLLSLGTLVILGRIYGTHYLFAWRDGRCFLI